MVTKNDIFGHKCGGSMIRIECLVDTLEELVEAMFSQCLVDAIEAYLSIGEQPRDVRICIADLIRTSCRDLVDLGVGAILLLLVVNIEHNTRGIVIGIELRTTSVTILIDIAALTGQPCPWILIPGFVFSPDAYAELGVTRDNCPGYFATSLRMDEIACKDNIKALLRIGNRVIEGRIDRLGQEMSLDTEALTNDCDVGLLVAEDLIDSRNIVLTEWDVGHRVEKPERHFGWL